ncbi:MAG: PTS sugar transporter subunit IIA [Tyzzerella sp.]|uniref:PTS sugar transporter subunit IIA n=1 Tax=Candidatus Fimicola merdigallinarum TaxID=2840819 RepID=A0A9D9H4N6_9FIRM|nr:PTS sugar transporter subunit IIA [Candidatus Fimicola merdigallinarum]
MKSDMIYSELIQLDWEVKNQEEFFEKMAKKLEELGFVKSSFLSAIKEREKNYPTALNINPYPIAIPHVDPENIIKPFIAATRLKNPITWFEMGTSDVKQEVKFIFMLGFLKSDEHIMLLQTLLQNCQDEEIMNRLVESNSVEDYYKALIDMKDIEM